MIERFERFSYAISEISRNWHRLATDVMQEYGLKGTHCTYLVALEQSEGGLTAPQICEVCGKDKSDVSRMMKILEIKNLVSKKGEYHNRYGGVFQLTEEGRKAAEEVSKKAAKAVEIAGQDLTDEQRQIFYNSLESIASNLKIMAEEGALNK